MLDCPTTPATDVLDDGRLRSSRDRDGRNANLPASIRIGITHSAAAWVSPDTPDVAAHRSTARAKIHSGLRGSSWLWTQRMPAEYTGPRTICQAGHGARHDRRHGAARISAFRGRRS